MAQRGDIILARFPFTDLSGAKLRPVLTLAPVPGPHQDYVVMFISSQLTQAVPHIDVILDRTSPAFVASGLKAASVFRIGKVASLSAALIVGTLGHLEPRVFDDILDRLVRLIRPS